MNKNIYDYVIVGGGIAGCSTAYFLSKYNKNILLIDRNSNVSLGASGAAGAFLSPLLGKPNNLKSLVTEALKFSTKFYMENIPSCINNCGVVRIPKTKEDKNKFESYLPYMDFEYKNYEDGYLFKIGSQVIPYCVSSFLVKEIDKLLDYEVLKIKRENNFWILNDNIKTKKLILTTGADISLIQEKYFNIRAVWGQKIDVYTETTIDKNYHKSCSLSQSQFCNIKNKNIVSIGATHNRVDINLKFSNDEFKKEKKHDYFKLGLVENDINKLLNLANEIKKLEAVELKNIKIGARASSLDYLPIVGKLVNSQKTLQKYPHLINGTFIQDDKLTYYDNLYVLNGVGGRGYVLSPYLAYNLVENIIKNETLDINISTARLFKRWVKKYK